MFSIQITIEDIKKTYGGSGGSARGYYSGAYSSSTNAYMLMYRQINKELNCHAIVEEEFPAHIKVYNFSNNHFLRFILLRRIVTSLT